MKTYYLIDYENVGSDGLSGCDTLGKTDCIMIFFTKNAKKIDMSEIANHGDAELNMIEVPAGKQSADIHIGSYLGYLSGTSKGKDCSVVIVSRDMDFDNVISFWNTKTGIKASRLPQIKPTEKKKPAKSVKKENKKNEASADGSFSKDIIKAVKEAGFDSAAANAVAQLASGFLGFEHLSNEVHNALQDKYQNYREVYEAVKSVLSKYEKKAKTPVKESAAPVSDKVKLNTEIMQTLAKAGFESEVCTFTASTVVKNRDVKGGKQKTYRQIISKFGQAKGLDVYNQIKKKI